MVLVDSSVWVEYFNGIASRETDLLDELLGRELLLTGDIILAEVLGGFDAQADYQRARRLMNALAYEDMLGREVAQLLHSAGSHASASRPGFRAIPAILQSVSRIATCHAPSSLMQD